MNFEEAMDHLYNNYGHATAYEQALQCAIEGLHGKFLHLKERSDLMASEEMKMRDRYKARSQDRLHFRNSRLAVGRGEEGGEQMITCRCGDW